MAGSFTDYFENALLNRIFRGATYTFPTSLWIGLHTVAPTDSTGGTEVSGNGYARKEVVANTTNFTEATGVNSGTTSNATVITFDQATGLWNTVVSVGIYDAQTGGNLLAYSTLSTPKLIDNGDTASFAIGDLDITLN